MKKRVLLSLLLGVAGVFAAQEPKQEARMVPIEELVHEFSREYIFGAAQRSKLEGQLQTLATPAGLVDFSKAEHLAKDIAGPQGLGMPQEIVELGDGDGGQGKVGKAVVKTPEQEQIEGVVGKWFPGPIAELVGSYHMPWKIVFGGEKYVKLPWGGKVYGLQASADGRRVAVQKSAETIDIWNMQSMTKEKTVKFEAPGRRWVFSPGFDRAAALVPGKNRVAIVDVESGKVLNSIPGFASGLGFFEQKNGELCLVLYNQMIGFAITYDMRTGKHLKRYPLKDFLGQANKALPSQVTFSVDGKLVVGEMAGEAIVWDVEKDALVKKIKLRKGLIAKASTFAFSFDKQRLAISDFIVDPSGYLSSSVYVYDFDQQASIVGLEGGHEKTSMVFSPDGDFLLAGLGVVDSGPLALNLPERERRIVVEPVAKVEPPMSVRPQEIRVTVDDFMQALEVEGVSLMEEDQLDEIRKQLRELAQTSPDQKIYESVAQQIADDVLHAVAPQELASDADIPPLADVPEGESEDVEEKEEMQGVSADLPGVAGVRRLNEREVMAEFGSYLDGGKKRLFMNMFKQRAESSKSGEQTITYDVARELFNTVSDLGEF